MARSPNASLNIFQSNGRLIYRWQELQRQAFARLKDTLNLCVRPLLRHSCTHIKGNFGVKGADSWVLRASQQGFIYVARFDVAQYYRSMII